MALSVEDTTDFATAAEYVDPYNAKTGADDILALYWYDSGATLYRRAKAISRSGGTLVEGSTADLVDDISALEFGPGGIETGKALAVVNDAPADYAGAIVWEGMLSTPDPGVQALNQLFCAQVQALLAGGVLFDGSGGAIIQTLARQAELVPGGLTPVPLFPPVLTNRQALVSFFAAPPPGPVTTPVPGYYFLAGDPLAGSFDFASEERVITDVERFVAYAPLALTRDVSCALAGLDTTHVANLGVFTGRVLGIGGGGGFGPYIPDNLALFTSAADVDFLLEPDFGHIDHFMTPDHQRYVERPILRWLRRQEP